MTVARPAKACVFLLAGCLLLPVPTESFWLPSYPTIRAPSFFRAIRLKNRESTPTRSRHCYEATQLQSRKRSQPSTSRFYPRVFRLFMTAAEQPSPETPQSAFLALLKLSKLLEANNNKNNKDVAAETAANAEDNVYFHPSIQLAVGAAKAFGAIDRNLVRAVSELGTLNESLQRMASEQSDFLSKYIIRKRAETETLSTDDASRQAIREKSVASVKSLMSMDRRISRAISELYQVGASFKNAEAKNNEFIALLSETATAAIPNLQQQAAVTSQSFDDIDDRLSKALAEVKFIGASFKTLEADVNTETQVFQASGATRPSSTPGQVPFSLPPSVSVQGVSPSPGSSASAAVEQPFQDAKDRVESALYMSIQVAQAFDTVGADMALNDEKMLLVLKELRTSVQRLAKRKSQQPPLTEVSMPEALAEERQQPDSVRVVSSASPPPVEEWAQQDVVSVAPNAKPPPVLASPVAPQPMNVDKAPVIDEAPVWEETRQLSNAAAEAWETVNSNMVENDAKALSVLQEISESFRLLASNDNILAHLVKKAPPTPVNLQEPYVQSVPAPPPKVPESGPVPPPEPSTVGYQPNLDAPPQDAAGAAVSVPSMSSDKTKDSSLENSMKLAIAAAEAFNEIDDNMSRHYDSFLAELRDLQASLRRIASAKKTVLLSPQSQPPSSATGSTVTPRTEDVTTAPAIELKQQETQSLPPKQQFAAIPSLASTTQETDSTHDKDMALTLEATKAFYNVDSNMNANDERMISILQEISSSLRNLSKEKGIKALPALDDSPPTVAPKPAPPPVVRKERTTNFDTKPMTFAVDSARQEREMAPPTEIQHHTEAMQLGLQAAAAFGDVDSAMAENDERMIAILHEIRSSLENMSTQHTQHASAAKPQLTPRAESLLTPTSLPETDALTPISLPETPKPVQVSSIEKPPSDEIRQDSPANARNELATEQAIQEAARAFQAVDASMVKNDERTLALLKDINMSLGNLVDMDTASSIAPPEKTPDTTPEPPALQSDQQAATLLELPIEPEPKKMEPVRRVEASASQEPVRRTVSPTLQEEDAQELALEAANAFIEVDSNMNANDGRMLAVLQDISSTLRGVVQEGGDMATPGRDQPQVAAAALPSIVVAESTPKSLQTDPVPPLDTNMGTTEVQAGSNAKTGQIVMDARRAQQLSTDAADAFGRVDTAMAENDQKAIGILHEIRASLRRLEHVEPALMEAEPPKEPPRHEAPSIPAAPMEVESPKALPKQEALAAPIEAAPPATLEPLKSGDKVDASSREDESEMAKVQAILETARAFEAVDESMVRNDERTLVVLNEISTSLAQMVELENLKPCLPDIPPETSLLEPQTPPEKTPEPSTLQIQQQVAPAEMSTDQQVTAAEMTTDPVPEPEPTGIDDLPSQDATQNQEAAANSLAREIAKTFGVVDSNMNANDKKMLSVLHDISSTLKIFAEDESDVVDTTAQKDRPYVAPTPMSKVAAAESTPVLLQSGPVSPPVQAKYEAQVQAEPVPQPRVQQLGTDTTDVEAQSRAQQLGTDAAEAFGRVDAAMAENDEKAISILREIRVSLKQLEHVEPAPAKAIPQTEAPREIPKHELEVAAPARPPVGEPAVPPKSINTDNETIGVSSHEHSEVAKAQAILKTARAFEAVDESMVKNDKKTLAVLNEISASLVRMVELENAKSSTPPDTHPELLVNTQKPPERPANLPVQQPIPLSGPPTSTEEQPQTEAIPAIIPSFPVDTSVSVKNVVEARETELAYGKAMDLSLRAARALNEIDNTMSQNDQISTSILFEINASFHRLVEADKLHREAAMAATRPSVESPPIAPTPPVQVASSSSAPVPPPKPLATRPEEYIREAQSEEATAGARAANLSLEAARAFNDMDAKMMENDEKSLHLLKEISQTFGKLAEHGNLSPLPRPSPENQIATPPSKMLSPPLRPSRDIKCVTPLQEPPAQPEQVSHESMSSSPQAPETEQPSAIAHQTTQDSVDAPAEDWYAPAAEAFNKINRDMSRNDEAVLDEYRKMSSMFKKLASFTSGSAPPDPFPGLEPPKENSGLDTPSDEEDRGKVVPKYEATEESNLTETEYETDGSTTPELGDIAFDGGAKNDVESTSLDQSDNRGTETDYEEEFKSNLQLSIEAAETFLELEEISPTHDGDTLAVLTEIVSSLRVLAANNTDVPTPLFEDPPVPKSKKMPGEGRLQQLGVDYSDFLSAGGPTNETPETRITSLANALDKVIATAPQNHNTLLGVLGGIRASIQSLSMPGFNRVPSVDEAMSELRIWEQALALSKASAKALGEFTAAMTEGDEVILDELRSLSESFKWLASDSCDFWACFEGTKQQNIESKEASTILGFLPDAQVSERISDFNFAVEGAEEDQKDISQQDGLTEGGPENSPIAPASRRSEDGPISTITGQIIRPEEYERRKKQVTAGVVDEMGTVLVRGLDRRLTELNEISSRFKEFARDSSANRTDDTQPDLTLSSASELRQEVSHVSTELRTFRTSVFKSVPSPFSDLLVEQESSLLSQPIPTVLNEARHSLALPNSSGSPPSSREEEIQPSVQDKPVSFYDDYMRERSNGLYGPGPVSPTSNIVQDIAKPPVVGGGKPASELGSTSPPQSLENSSTATQAGGGSVGTIRPPPASTLAAVGTLSVGVGLAISCLPDELLTGTGLEKIKHLEALGPIVANITQSIPSKAMQKFQSMKSIVPALGDFTMINLPTVDLNVISFDIQSQADSFVRNLGHLNQPKIDSLTTDAKRWKGKVEQKLPKRQNNGGDPSASDASAEE